MKKTVRFLQIAALMIALALAATAQADWTGSYSFYENGGKNAGGAAILITHELTVFEGGDGLAASMESNGYQTAAELVCTAKTQGSKLLIYFQNYGETNMFEPYQPGDLLLTLEKTTVKGGPAIVTHWGKFTASIPKNEKSGKIYFEKNKK